jgi:hypothetical protein
MILTKLFIHIFIVMSQDNQLTDSKLRIAYWIVTNKLFIQRIIFFLLFTFDVLIVSFSVYSVIQYYSVERVQFEKAMSTLERYNLDYQNYQKKIEPDEIQILELDAVDLGSNRYNFVARVKNPNINSWIAREVHYNFVYNNEKTKTKIDFILPGEDKFLGAFNIESLSKVLKPRLEISYIRWERIKKGEVDKFVEKVKKYTDFDINNEKYLSTTDLGLPPDDVINAVKFTVVNNTIFDYYDVGFFIVTYNGPIITSANYLTLNDFMSKEVREEEVRWHNIISEPSLIVVKTEVDFFEETAIMSKDHIIGEVK